VVIAVAVAIAMIAVAVFVVPAMTREDEREQLVIATGPVGGTYYAFGQVLADLLRAAGVARSIEVVPTDGSVVNMALVGGPNGGADLAFVQSDTRPAAGVRLIAPLYQEVLHVVVGRRVADEITTVGDLEGRSVSLGMKGSGTRSVAQRVVDHFGVTLGRDLALSPEEVADGLVDGSVDAAFILSAIPSAGVDALCENEAVRFLSLGDAQELGNEADALALVFPSLKSTVIPRGTYQRLPEQPVATIEVSALLVGSSRLPSDLVKSLTTTLFAHRSRFVAGDSSHAAIGSRIRERFQPDVWLIPYHEGAVDYYHRSDPPFVVEYAESISLLLTVLVGLFSFSVAIREWVRRRKKNRIDDFYVEVEELTSEVEGLGLDDLRERRRALRNLQRRAFGELVSERLEANESFTIFQDYLASERASITARINEKSLAQRSAAER
jgi:TRAP transporter TAXI family solute receptor